MKTNIFSRNIDIYFFVLLFAMILDQKYVLVVLTVLGALLSIALLVSDWKYYVNQLIVNRYLFVSLAFLIPIGIAMVDTFYPEKRYRVFNTMFVYMLLGVLPIFMVRFNANFKRLSSLVVIGIIFISVDAIVQWLTDYHILGYNPIGGSRVRGVFGSWYHLSYFLGTFAPILFFYFYEYLEKRVTISRIIVVVIALLLFVTALMLGGARAGMVSLIVSVFLFISYLFITNKVRKKLQFLGIVFGASIVLLFLVSLIPEVQSRFINTTSTFGSDSFFEQFTSLRPNIWYVAFTEVPNYLFNGVGTRGFNNLYLTYPESYRIYDYVDHPHLHGLEVLIETGLIGFIPYLLVCLYLLVRMFKAKSGNMWLMMGFIAMMPINSHVPIYQNYWFPIIWVPIMLGLALAQAANEKGEAS